MKFLIVILAVGVCSYTATATLFIPRINIFGTVLSKLAPMIRYISTEEIRQKANTLNKGVITLKYPKVGVICSIISSY